MRNHPAIFRQTIKLTYGPAIWTVVGPFDFSTTRTAKKTSSPKKEKVFFDGNLWRRPWRFLNQRETISPSLGCLPWKYDVPRNCSSGSYISTVSPICPFVTPASQGYSWLTVSPVIVLTGKNMVYPPILKNKKSPRLVGFAILTFNLFSYKNRPHYVEIRIRPRMSAE